MFKLVSAAFVGAALLPCANAEAKYISLSGGMVGESDFDYATPAGSGLPAGRVTNDADSGGSFAGAYGINLGPNTRAEFGVSYRSQELDGRIALTGLPVLPLNGDKVTATSADLGLFYDFGSGKVRPYIGGLIGIANLDIDDGLIDDNSATAKLAGILGLSFAASEKVSLFVDARYEYVGKVEIQATNGANTASTDINLDGFAANAGIRFAF